MRHVTRCPAVCNAGRELCEVPCWSLDVAGTPAAAAQEVTRQIEQRRVFNISVQHARGNPLLAEDIASRVDLRHITCVMVLADAAWSDPDLDDKNGIAEVGSWHVQTVDGF